MNIYIKADEKIVYKIKWNSVPRYYRDTFLPTLLQSLAKAASFRSAKVSQYKIYVMTEDYVEDIKHIFSVTTSEKELLEALYNVIKPEKGE